MRPASPAFGARAVVALVLASVAGAAFLVVSHFIGRLALDLEYDDVAYAMDAVDRVDTLRHDGLGPFLHGWLAAPPHAPIATVQAVAAFLLGGVRELPFYASNVWILWAAALGIAAIARTANRPTFLAVLAFALGSSFAYAAQAEYRPDMALGIATAAMAWTLASAALDGRPRRVIAAGGLLGLALLLKPTFFAHTLVIAGVLALACLAAGHRSAPAVLRPLALPAGAIAAFFAVGFAIALPYAIVGGPAIAEYFWTNTFGRQGRLWNLGAEVGAADYAAAMLADFHGLGRYHLYASLVAAPAFAAFLWRRGRRVETLRLGMLVFAALVSFAIIFAGRQPSPFFFASVDCLLMLAAIQGFVACDRDFAPRTRNRLFGGLALTVAVGVVFAYGSRGTATPEKDFIRVDRSENTALVRAIHSDFAAAGGGAAMRIPRVFAGTAGLSNALTLRWVARRAGFAIAAEEHHALEGFEALQASARGADYVVLALPGTDPFEKGFGPQQERLLAWARAEPGFEPLPVGDAAVHALFANRARTPRFDGQRRIPG